jgi:hypothetical protein
MKTFRHFWRYLSKFFSEWEMFETRVVEKIKTRILCSITFLRKSYSLWDSLMAKSLVESEGPQITSQHGAYAVPAGLARLHARMRMHTLTRPGTHRHARTHRQISNTYRFSTATMMSKRAWMLTLYKVVQIWPGRFVCKQVTVCPGHIWTTLYVHCLSCCFIPSL